jgi:DNA-binding transcriptional LysR family regulator
MSYKRSHLQYFVAVADEGQITGAAEKLHIAQPALSQAMTRLESELGFAVFVRHARGVTLTAAGRTFLDKARAVLAATEDASLTAESLARASRATVAFGYVGLPPAITNPDLLETFTLARPDASISLHELPFPTLPTATWLQSVDVAICTRPAPDDAVSAYPLRAEPRAVLAQRDHRLADRPEVSVADVLDETFLGFDASIDPGWAGFWSLDDHRGGPPREIVSQHVTTPQQRFAALAAGNGIATAPACHATVIANALPGLIAIQLTDARPALLTLVAHKNADNPLVDALLATAQMLAEHAPPNDV